MSSFCTAKATFFQQKNSAYLRINVNFKELLTNDSFEQLGPGVLSRAMLPMLAVLSAAVRNTSSL